MHPKYEPLSVGLSTKGLWYLLGRAGGVMTVREGGAYDGGTPPLANMDDPCCDGNLKIE